VSPIELDLSVLKRAASAIEKETADKFTSLTPSAAALLLSLSARKISDMVYPWTLLICHSDDLASRLYSDALFWAKILGTERPQLIPPKGNPYCLKNLFEIYNKKSGKLVTSVEAAMSPAWMPEDFPVFKIRTKTTVNRDTFIKNLQNIGYSHVPVVSGYGEMSVRGGIIDLFPPGEELPLRLEFFGDYIESLRSFDTDTQRTVRELDEITIIPASGPDEGSALIHSFKNSLIFAYEPDDLKRHYPDIEELFHGRKVISLISLPLSGEGFDCDVRGLGGLGILPEERRQLSDVVKMVKDLSNHYFILIVSSSESQARRLRELFEEGGLDVPVIEQTMVAAYEQSPIITVGDLSRGFVCNRTIVIGAVDILEKNLFTNRSGNQRSQS
jgi:transcription-repair coupling factor (superfamily II helicase)